MAPRSRSWSLFLLIFNICHSQLQYPLTQWTTITSPPMPSKKATLFTGYESSTERIWLVGSGANQIWSYNLQYNNFSEYGNLNLVLGKVNSQCSVQWGSLIFFVNEGILHEFSFKTAQLTSFRSTLHSHREAPCVSAVYPDYVFATGGLIVSTDSTNGYSSVRMQIYPASGSAVWYLGPNMNEGRSKHACVVYNNYLYAFGGAQADSAGTAVRESSERIYIGDIANIASYSWSLIAYIPGSNIYFHRAVVDSLNNQIYLIGGRDFCCIQGTASRGIQIYDISTSSMTLISEGSGISNIGRSSPSVILVNNHIYVFGGANTAGTDYYDSYEISNPLTVLPTKTPTSTPTLNPTKTTVSPTYNPTMETTYGPTEFPSSSPPNNPSYPPTNSPSSYEVSGIDSTSISSTQLVEEANIVYVKVQNERKIVFIIIIFIAIVTVLCLLIVILMIRDQKLKNRVVEIEMDHMRKVLSVSSDGGLLSLPSAPRIVPVMGMEYSNTEGAKDKKQHGHYLDHSSMNLSIQLQGVDIADLNQINRDEFIVDDGEDVTAH